ncbi:hypothetical protein A2304_03575 [Candidatus Uhrbacteria bacterium RIFOXYB2_FULL_57_15]|uniref:DUF5667 domain-containing protein n=1 Tax=Candidatus Uhrbacteria bacterium RIFOXYB2_FULL_57_15 TaxID=1802422 RepID=A0A1F7W5P0_9BACT|nr:MAG: hypothetical protein A2304_03575 [Candidatus Uhrbacteria bacterium RIFOXYB2_FULL_57_15]OGM00116.1 MAG: hypothetical protein A2501_01230 [Candidatus Uhrbacteria bacterium RIFOXYC12_FULL_57_11]
MTKKTLLIGAIVAALGAGAIGVGTSLAAQAENREPGFVSEIVTALAERFDLDPTAVQEVFDEQAEANHEEMQARHNELFEDRLAKAVEEGTLTQEQADAVLAKRDEMQAYAETLRDTDPEERKDAMKEKIDALRDWAEENDIPPGFLRFVPLPRNGQGQGREGNGMNHFGNGMGMMR